MLGSVSLNDVWSLHELCQVLFALDWFSISLACLNSLPSSFIHGMYTLYNMPEFIPRAFPRLPWWRYSLLVSLLSWLTFPCWCTYNSFKRGIDNNCRTHIIVLFIYLQMQLILWCVLSFCLTLISMVRTCIKRWPSHSS